MPIPAAVVSALTSIGSAIASGIVQNNVSKRANDRSFNQTKELFGLQQFDRDRQNAYGAPAEAIARLRAAGLSPASYYGGPASAGVSAGVATPGSAEVSTPDIAGAVQSGSNSAINALIRPQELELSRNRTESEIELNSAYAVRAMSEAAKTDTEKRLADEMFTTTVQRAKTDLDNAIKQGVVLEKEALLKDVDIRYREAGIKLTENEVSLNNKQIEFIDKQMERLGFENLESLSRIRLNESQANLADATANEVCYRVQSLLPAMVADFAASKDLKNAQYWNTDLQTDFQKYYNEHVDELFGDRVRSQIKSMDAETRLATAKRVQSWIKLPADVFKDVSFGVSCLIPGLSGNSSGAGSYVMSAAL